MLAGMPEKLRRADRDGDFGAGSRCRPTRRGPRSPANA